MTAGWPLVNIGEICEIQRGGSPRPISSHTTVADDGINWIKIGDVAVGAKYLYSTSEKITPEGARRSRMVYPGDFILSNSMSFGRPYIMRTTGCIHDGWLVLRDTKKRLCEDYLYRVLSSDFVVSQFKNMAVGAVVKNLNKEVVQAVIIPLPPLIEQRRIAAILDQADALRAKRREALAQLDSLTQSIFIEMFGDPVSNPKGWPTKKFADVGTLDRGVSKHRPRNAPELLGGAYPLVQTGEIANCDGYVRSHNSSYSEFGLRQSKLWPKGTLCITIAANIAKTGILTFDACFPDSVVGFKSEKPETVEFVRVWLSFLQKALEAAAPESAQKNINLAILRDLDIPFPPSMLQKTFVERVRSTEALRHIHRSALTELDTLFASLQHRAFSGTL